MKELDLPDSIEELIIREMCIGLARTFPDRLLTALHDYLAERFEGHLGEPVVKKVWESIRFRGK